MSEVHHTPKKPPQTAHASPKLTHRDALVALAYRFSLGGLLLSALALPIASVEVSTKSYIESVLLTMQKPLSMDQAENMLRLVGVTLPEDTRTSYNVLQTVSSLITESHLLAATIVAVGSVLLPIAKAASRIFPNLRGHVWKAVQMISGRFALLDVMIVAVIAVAVSSVSGWSVSIGPAAWFYLGFALLYNSPPACATRTITGNVG